MSFVALLTQASSAGGSPSEVWYKVVTGIIAIPAGIIGLALSYNILHKTTLESKKLERELAATQPAPGASAVVAVHDVGPTAGLETRRLVLIVLRYILLDLTLRIWNVVPSIAGYLMAIATYGVFFLRSEVLGSPRVTMAATAVPQVVTLLFAAVYWLMVFRFGWPLLQDTSRMLGIELPSVWSLPSLRGQRAELEHAPHA